VIVSGSRTAIGKFGGAYAEFSGAQLGGFAIKDALAKAKLEPNEVDYVVMGQVLQAGTGQITARQAATGAGIPMTVPAVTINKVCLSGLNAIALADQLIRVGEVARVVAGGMESMTQAPYLAPKMRFGARLGDAELIDSMMYDGLFCAFDQKSMGLATDEYNTRFSLTREEQDEFAARSHALAAKATEAGKFEDEIVPVEVPQRKGDPLVVTKDEGIRGDTTIDSLGKLRPAFAKEGTITAGNASQISDGAAACVVMSADEADKRGVEPLATIVAHGMVAGPDASLHEQPANAIKAALAKTDIKESDLDVVEINEAFASVGVVSGRALTVDLESINPNGGAIALGHPIGASGARLVITLAHELRRRGGGVGAAALCGGGGQGDALIIRV
ncbi:MAG TPA: acetyl-CoA C-acetyltransferase, partial [Actinomycetota bacterium]|nr:acetyl-CoA C-acetyltransferase [Actinomycetota bacterium]